MSAVVLDRPESRLATRLPGARAYMALTRRLARAAARGDEMAVRRLLMRREGLISALGPAAAPPLRALASEVRALEAQTMVSLGVEPRPLARPPAATALR